MTLASSEDSLVSIDENGLLQSWNFTTSEPCPTYTLETNRVVTCAAVYKTYVVLGTMLGRILIVKDSKIATEIYAHRGQVASISIRREAEVEPSVVCSVGEDGTYLTFTSSGIKFKHGIIENAMFTGVTWTANNTIGLAAYGRDYIVTEAIG